MASEVMESTLIVTGFVVAGDNHRLRLLTCAHGLDHLFKRSHPISFSTANKLIATTVCCDHLEHQYRQGGLIGERPYSNASIIAIDCAHDLMLVDVVIDNLRDMHGAICHNSHRSVRLAREVMGDKISKCLLLSWPPQKHRKRTEGHTSTMRRVTEISEPNLNEYNMDLVEVNMGVESGSSGGPLFNGAGEVLGLLHAGGIFDDTDSSYFVRVHHLHNFVAPYV
uniref:Uncharacterized protein n=1 Tax=Avena sativa TaxID=4498 RepID=A0ACD5Y5D8_AVESA